MDQLTDTNFSELFKACRDVDLPMFMKKASENMTTTTSAKQLPNHAFADPVNRRYPCASKQDTYASAAYFFKSASQDESIGNRILDMCDFWGIGSADIAPLIQKNIQKVASVQETIKYCTDSDVFKEVTVTCAEDLQKIANDILDSPERYPYQMRRNVCEQVLEKAASFDCEFDNIELYKLQKVAGQGVAKKSKVLDVLHERANLYKIAGHQHLQESMHKLEQKLEKTPVVVSSDILTKIAKIVDVADRASNLHSFYNTSVKTPEDSLFQITSACKDILKQDAIVIQTGRIIQKTAIESRLGEYQAVLENIFNIHTQNTEDVCSAMSAMSSEDVSKVIRFVS